MKAIKNYKGRKNHIAVALSKEDIRKIVVDYFDDLSQNSEVVYTIESCFSDEEVKSYFNDPYVCLDDRLIELYIRPTKDIPVEESNLKDIPPGNMESIFKDSTFFDFPYVEKEND